MIRLLPLTFGTLAALPLLGLAALIPSTPITLVGSLYLIGGILIVAGTISAPWWRRGSPTLALLGTTLILAIIALRMLFPPSGSRLVLTSLPSHSGAHWLNRIFDEQDVVLFGARVGLLLGFISPAENNGLVPALAEAYGQMQEATPLSPFLVTYLNQQHPSAFDVVVAEAAEDTQPKQGIIFLHGFGGNFTLQCWLMARAGERIGVMTVCPSTRPSGDWWSPQGVEILHQTLAYLQQRGVERIYLAGLSNGGLGASRLAQRFESALAGLILISGADPDAPITRLHVLVIQGNKDERVPVWVAERYIAAAGTASTYLLLEGDHFVLLRQADRVQGAIADWIKLQEAHQRRPLLRQP
jgi:pimeloyl-ACP methyl ester carboxylesterase